MGTSQEGKITCPRAVQGHGRQNTSMEKGDGHEVPPLVKGLGAIDNCWQKECQL